MYPTSHRYTRIPTDHSKSKELLVKPTETADPLGLLKRTKLPNYLGSFCLLVVSLVIGIAIGNFLAQYQAKENFLQGVVPQGYAHYLFSNLESDLTYATVSIGSVRSVFRFNDSFAKIPPESGGPEPVWDSLIPSKLCHLDHTKHCNYLTVDVEMDLVMFSIPIYPQSFP